MVDLIYDAPKLIRSVTKRVFEPKMKVAVYDKDLKARRVKKYPISPSGEQISIRKGGKGNFNPHFNADSVLRVKIPWWKLWKAGWEEICVVPNGASKCINFRTLDVTGPSPEDVKEAAKAEILKGIGEEGEKKTPLSTYILLGLLALIAMRVFGMI